MFRLCKRRTGTMRALAGRICMGAIESAARTGTRVEIDAVSVDAYTIPTEEPESDGTLEWRATTLIVVHVSAGGVRGFGYTYADRAAAVLIAGKLAPLLQRQDANDIPARYDDMARELRNVGVPGLGAMAMSAVDGALWDAKAKHFGVPLATLLGRARQGIAAYGSGGFTSYGDDELCDQLGSWAESGMRFVKMKVGRDAQADARRVRAAARAIGTTELFVDANGAYTRKQALAQADAFAANGVTWFEEPVSSDDLDGLRLLRDRAPAGMAIAAGEYGSTLPYFQKLLGLIDVLQADATRCGGITGFLGVDALCDAHGIPLSSHCAPSLHLPLMCAARRGAHLEYFYDHARIESLLFDGFQHPLDGLLRPSDRPGLGVELKARDAERFRCS
jgi:L-alanine-DL-glutamate epimerase-like enolase superfamily enzyme